MNKTNYFDVIRGILEQRRVEMGLSMLKFSEQIDISIKHYERFVYGQSGLGLAKTLYAFEKLNISLDDVIKQKRD